MTSEKGRRAQNLISATERSAMLQCTRRWYFRYGMGVKPAFNPAPYRFGTLWHSMMELVYRRLSLSTQDELHHYQPFWSVVEQEARDYVDEWKVQMNLPGKGTHGPFRHKDLAVSFKDEIEDNASLCLNMLERYVRKYMDPREGSDGDRYWDIVAIETAAKAWLPAAVRNSTTDLYAGRIDMLIKDKNGFALVEHKTTAQTAISRERELAIDPQALGYLWLARKTGIIGKRDPIRVIYRIARKAAPKSPKTLKGGKLSTAHCDTTPDIYRQSIVDSGEDPSDERYADRLAYLESKVTGKWFHSFDRWVSDVDLQRFELEVRTDARRIAGLKNLVKSEADIHSFSMNWNACMVPGRSCSYVPLCRSGYEPELDRDGSGAATMGFSTGNSPHPELDEEQ